MSKGFMVVTGANRKRGIGLALVRAAADAGYEVVGTFRQEKNSQALLDLAASSTSVHALRLDVACDESAAEFGEQLGQLTDSIDVLVNNAGVPAISTDILRAPIEALTQQVQVHGVGVVRVTKACLTLLRKSRRSPATVVVISSMLGAIGSVGGAYQGYAAAKTLANALTRTMASVLRPMAISCWCVHPGWCATDIGGLGAPVRSETSASHLLRLIEQSSMSDNDTFRDYRGGAMRW